MNEKEAQKHPRSRGEQADQEAYVQKRIMRDYHRMQRVDYRNAALAETGVTVRNIKAKLLVEGGTEWMVIVSACKEGYPVVGFHTGEGLHEALAGACYKLMTDRLKWKEDEYGSC